MRRTIAIAPLLFLSLACLSAQPDMTTPLIELSKDDSVKAQAVHETLEQSRTDFTSLQQQMYRGYVKDSNTQGFPVPLFSADFRFLVGAGEPAPILELAQEDTAKLVAAHDRLVQARNDVEAFHQHILETYLAVRGSEKGVIGLGNPMVMVPEDRGAFQLLRYTQDYRFILPKQPK